MKTWEYIDTIDVIWDSANNDTLARLPVSGGWLYRCVTWRGNEFGVGLTFVPECADKETSTDEDKTKS